MAENGWEQGKVTKLSEKCKVMDTKKSFTHADDQTNTQLSFAGVYSHQLQRWGVQ